MSTKKKPLNHEKYYICERLDNLDAVPRTDFMQSICGDYDMAPKEIEDLIAGGALHSKVKVSDTLVELASFYRRHSRAGARLPNFPRWVNGLYKDNKDNAKVLAVAGQMASVQGKVTISGEPLDIMRCADTEHFASCLRSADHPKNTSNFYIEAGYDKIPRKIVEECPGIVIAYTEDDNGYYKGRMFLHHAQLDSGEDIVVMSTGYGVFQFDDSLTRTLKNAGLKVYVPWHMRYNFNERDGKKVKGKYVGAFTEHIHWDIDTWSDTQYFVEV